MFQELAKLVIYRNLEKDCILFRLGDICRDFSSNCYEKEELISRIYEEIHRLLDVATIYGFDENLWHNYLTYLLISTENPFSITCEKVGAIDGSVNQLAKNDFKIFKALFDYDFSKIEEALDINCFHIITNYKAIEKTERRYNKSVSEKVRMLSKKIEKATNENEVFEAVTTFYKDYGVGKFGLNKAFRLFPDTKEFIRPITNTDEISLEDLIGYEIQKKKLIDNTEAFVEGRKCNNVLLFGDSGTGKSTSIKAILNQYYDRGLRMIEIYKHQFKELSNIIAEIKNRNYRFIIYMDDLSFEEFEIEYKFLKAVIEGGLETKPDNVLIYATSNRRHLIRETWSDRSDMVNENELHHSDTMQEKLSLVNRFGISINYSRPDQKEYFKIVVELAKKHGITQYTEQELCQKANAWELSHGGISGRTAQQFINYLAGIEDRK